MDIFYKLIKKDIREIKDILLWTHQNAIKTEISMLDCSKSFARERADKSFDEVMRQITDDALDYFRIILRKDCNAWGIISDDNKPVDFLEIGIRNIMINEIEHFLQLPFSWYTNETAYALFAHLPDKADRKFQGFSLLVLL
jgi:hypothetical protein